MDQKVQGQNGPELLCTRLTTCANPLIAGCEEQLELPPRPYVHHSRSGHLRVVREFLFAALTHVRVPELAALALGRRRAGMDGTIAADSEGGEHRHWFRARVVEGEKQEQQSSGGTRTIQLRRSV